MSETGTGSVLVVGGDGWLGRALGEALKRRGLRVISTTRRPGPEHTHGTLLLDLESDEARSFRPPEQISLAYLCAAVTSLETCRRSPDRSRQVNVERTVALGRTLAGSGAFVVFPSTSLVFDGSSPLARGDASPSPRCEYGRQKAEAESALLASEEGRVAVVRTTKILGPGVRLFDEWTRSLRMGRPVSAFFDMPIAPVSRELAVRALLKVGLSHLAGVFQLSACRDMSYAEAALHLARRLNADPQLVSSVSARSTRLELEHVPRFSSLDCARIASELGIPPPVPEEGLGAVPTEPAPWMGTSNFAS